MNMEEQVAALYLEMKKKDALFENYGKVPIPAILGYEGAFHILIISIIVIMLVFPKLMYNMFHLKNVPSALQSIIYLLPIYVVIYYDIKFNTFSLKNMFKKMFNIPYEFTDKHKTSINFMLRVIGAYGIIQVLAQDFGIKTGRKQGELMRNNFVQWILFFGTAFSILGNRSEAMIAATVYFILKHSYSVGETSPVCFEDV